MSALAGLVRFDGGSADARDVARMIDCVSHRGADWRNVWEHGSASFAYRWRRLGRSQRPNLQPIVEQATGVGLVMDGRLDNRRQLAEELRLVDEDTCTDADLTLAAYARWGFDLVTHLLGDFALAVWDPRTQCLLLARDPLGMRGLSYWLGPDFVAFATEPRQLLRLNGIDRRPNLGFFAEWTAGRMSHPSQTLFRGIERVQPAHIVTVTAAGLRSSRYWDIDPRREIRYHDDREYVEHFRALFASAVRARMRDLNHVGVLLSGGLDSSSLVAMASRLEPLSHPTAIRAYTLGLDGFPDGDDVCSAEAVARFCGVPLSCLPYRSAGTEFYVKLARILEDTIPSAVGNGRVALVQQAADDGCRVVFDGTGGDEWFGGAHQHTADLLKSGRVIEAIRQLHADASLNLGHGHVSLAKSSVWALVPDSLRRPIKRWLPDCDRMPRGFNRAFAEQVGLVERITKPLTDRRFTSIATGTAYVTATHPYGSYAWEEIARHDEIFGVELAAPLMDRRLAEFAMALPEEQRWARADSKRVLRSAMEGFLPHSTRHRHKADTGSVQFGHLRCLHADGVFDALELAEERIVDHVALGAMYREMLDLFAAGDARYKMLADQLWTFFLGECVWRALFGRHSGPALELTSGSLVDSTAAVEKSCGKET